MLRPLSVAFFLALSAQLASAQSRPTYIQFDPYTVKGALYRPDGGGNADIGVLLIHRVNNYLGHIAASELARRGFLVLAMNSRFDNNEASVLWERIALDVKTGVEYLRKQGGVRRVILFGHSGGAATLSFYQAVAEKGTSFCEAPGKLTVCTKELSGLPKGDGLILVDASLGNPVGLLRSLNPAVTQPNSAPIGPPQAAQEQRLDRHADRANRTAAGEPEPADERHLRKRRAAADAEIVPHRERHPIDELDDRRRVVLDQQLDAMCRSGDQRAAPRVSDGWQHWHPGQRVVVRTSRKPRQRLFRARRRDSQHRPVRRVRNTQGRVQQYRP